MELPTGVSLILLTSLFQGSFALFLKFTTPWKWENFWFVWSIIALIVSPIIWNFVLIPKFADVLLDSPLSALSAAFFFGAIWGVGGVLFGVCAARIGLSLTYSLTLGLTTSIGSLIPLLLNPLPATKVVLTLSAGILIILVGLAISAYAGVKREKLQRSRGFRTGLMLAIISGIASPMLNVGFVLGKEISETAKLMGASETSATLPIWIILLFGGFFANIGYPIYLLAKQQTSGLFFSKTAKPISFSVLSGLIWFAGIGLYGIATEILGPLGTSVGFGLYTSLMVVVSNVLGILTGEWRGSREALKYQLISIVTLVLGIIVIANSFTA